MNWATAMGYKVTAIEVAISVFPVWSLFLGSLRPQGVYQLDTEV